MKRIGLFLFLFCFFITFSLFFKAIPVFAILGQCDDNIFQCSAPILHGSGGDQCGSVRSMPGPDAGCIKPNNPTGIGSMGEECKKHPEAGFFQWCGNRLNPSTRGRIYCGCYPRRTVPPAGVYAPCGLDTALGYEECIACVEPGRTYEDGGSWTALGCIPNNPRELVVWVLGRAIGIGGGIAFLLMIWGGFQVITAAGNPDRLNAGKEIITSAIAGLLIIIFSLFLLELIGVDILGLEEVGFKFGGG